MSAPDIAPVATPLIDATVLICTYNRASYLGDTLDSIARSRAPRISWDVLVVDNNSTDNTREVVESRIANYPVRLRYLFEPVQGKSNALNSGMAAAPARVIVFTDDDVVVPEDWLAEAVRPLLERPDVDYTGGPVRAIWGAPKPAWIDEAGNLGGTLAVKNHGDRSFIFEDERKTPLGVNMAVRRALIERIGGFRPDLGRKGNSLLGQEQAEFFYRSRDVGARGMYNPRMVLDHHVPAGRLSRSYFRRWWYWKGVSHARLHRIHGQTELGLDLRTVPRIFGVPRFLIRDAAADALGWIWRLITGDRRRRAEHALMLAYFFGYARHCAGWSRRHVDPAICNNCKPAASARSAV